jgi:hypothetical protein
VTDQLETTVRSFRSSVPSPPQEFVVSVYERIIAAGRSGRQTRLRQRRRLLRVLVATAAALTAVVAVAPALGLHARLIGLVGAPVSTDRLSSQDLAVLGALASKKTADFSESRAQLLNQLGGTRLLQIAKREGRAYYVIDKPDGVRCFAAGDDDEPNALGRIDCPITPRFPSAALPILNLSVYHSSSLDDRRCCLWRLEGFAADAVTSVGVVTASGRIEAVTPVQDNVFLRTEDLPKETILGMVAFDANGNEVYRECFTGNAC